MPMESATIHVAQLVERSRSLVRSPQGSYGELSEVLGPQFAARLMFPAPTRPRADAGNAAGDTAREVTVRYEFLAQPVDVEGNPVTIGPSDRIRFIDAGPLGSPTIDVDGQPELLNNGVYIIGWYGFGVLVEEAANG